MVRSNEVNTENWSLHLRTLLTLIRLVSIDGYKILLQWIYKTLRKEMGAESIKIFLRTFDVKGSRVVMSYSERVKRKVFTDGR